MSPRRAMLSSIWQDTKYSVKVVLKQGNSIVDKGSQVLGFDKKPQGKTWA